MPQPIRKNKADRYQVEAQRARAIRMADLLQRIMHIANDKTAMNRWPRIKNNSKMLAETLAKWIKAKPFVDVEDDDEAV